MVPFTAVMLRIFFSLWHPSNLASLGNCYTFNHVLNREDPGGMRAVALTGGTYGKDIIFFWWQEVPKWPKTSKGNSYEEVAAQGKFSIKSSSIPWFIAGRGVGRPGRGQRG